MATEAKVNAQFNQSADPTVQGFMDLQFAKLLIEQTGTKPTISGHEDGHINSPESGMGNSQVMLHDCVISDQIVDGTMGGSVPGGNGVTDEHALANMGKEIQEKLNSGQKLFVKTGEAHEGNMEVKVYAKGDRYDSVVHTHTATAEEDGVYQEVKQEVNPYDIDVSNNPLFQRSEP